VPYGPTPVVVPDAEPTVTNAAAAKSTGSQTLCKRNPLRREAQISPT
jgi:hypothetical protein